MCRALLYMEDTMKTIPLYDNDGFIKEFTATVLDCRQVEDGWKIVLDQTGFFPEGGGQTADTGVLRRIALKSADEAAEEVAGKLTGEMTEKAVCEQDIHVLDVQKDGDIIWHKTDAPISVGTEVIGVLDWKVRFSKMQHHSGEHIVSGLVNRHFGYNNVGFHLGSHVVTLDFDGVLTREQLRQIEYEANEAVAADLPILVTYPAREELPHIRYRSKIEIEGQVRLVEIPGYDVCACCAPHLRTTGQIGLIKLVDMEHFRGGVRVYMLCGFAALADYNQKEDSVRAISQALSAREDRVAEAVEKLKQENYRQRGEMMNLSNALLECKVAAIPKNSERAVFVEAGLEGNQPRELANKLLEKGVGQVYVFAGNDEAGYRYVIASRHCDVRPIAKAVNETLQGRGGGKPEMVQGSVAAKELQIKEYFAL